MIILRYYKIVEKQSYTIYIQRFQFLFSLAVTLLFYKYW